MQKNITNFNDSPKESSLPSLLTKRIKPKKKIEWFSVFFKILLFGKFACENIPMR